MIKLSKGNTKLGKIWNISLIPIVDCKNCGSCKNKCYAKRAMRFPNVRKARKNNSQIFRNNMTEAFQDIKKQLVKGKPKYFRIHVAGDILNQQHLRGWIKLCKALPDIKFLMFTKRYELTYENIPNNLKIIFSMWTGLKDTCCKGFSRAWLQDGTEDRIPEDSINCAGHCTGCLKCWNLPANKDVVFDIH